MTDKILKIFKWIVSASMAVACVFGIIKLDLKLALTGGLGAMVLFLPKFVRRFLHWDIPVRLSSFLTLFIFVSAFLGSTLNFYDRFSWWDIALHFCSGPFLASVCISIMNPVCGRNIVHEARPVYVALTAFTFAMACGTLWEFYEFLADNIMGYEMQVHTIMADGTVDTGLWDTMTDELAAAASAAVYSISIFIRASLGKYKTLDDLAIKK